MTESSELKEVAEADLLDASRVQTRPAALEFEDETRENGIIYQSLNLRVILHLIMVSRRLLQALKL